MKRKLFLLLFLMLPLVLVLLIIIHLSSEKISYTNGNIPLDKIPRIYEPHTAKQNGDVVIWIDNYNIEKVEQFIANVERKRINYV